MIGTRVAPASAPTDPLLHTYDVNVQTISPVHVGSGVTLVRDYDFIIDGHECSVLDIDKAYSLLFDRLPEAQWEAIANLPIRRVLTAEGSRDDHLLRYRRMALGTGADPEGFEDVRACMRTPFGKAYLPASSLKGSLRTALAVGYASEAGPEWMSSQLGQIAQRRPRREFAARETDKAVFGNSPNEDVLRSVRPADLFVVGDDPSEAATGLDPCVRLIETRVTKRDGTSTATIMVEAFAPDTVLSGTLTVEANPVAHLDEAHRSEWEGLAQHDALGAIGFLRDHVAKLIDREKRHFAGHAMSAWYVGLERRLGTLPDDTTLMWVGWGSGWSAKTYGELLTADQAFPAIASNYRLGNADTFPTTRRLVYAGNRPSQPLGWVQIRITGNRSR